MIKYKSNIILLYILSYCYTYYHTVISTIIKWVQYSIKRIFMNFCKFYKIQKMCDFLQILLHLLTNSGTMLTTIILL